MNILGFESQGSHERVTFTPSVQLARVALSGFIYVPPLLHSPLLFIATAPHDIIRIMWSVGAPPQQHCLSVFQHPPSLRYAPHSREYHQEKRKHSSIKMNSQNGHHVKTSGTCSLAGASLLTIKIENEYSGIRTAGFS